MKCLVTGASGFIGSHLVKALEKREDEVVKTSLRFPINISGQLTTDIDYIFHLATYGNMSNQAGDLGIVKANLIGTFTLLELTKDIPYKAFINISTSSVLLPHETMYSATKAGAERLCKAFVAEYAKPITTIRPYSVYGPGEADFRFIPTVFRSCLSGDEMTLGAGASHDWTYIDDVVRDIINCTTNIDDLEGEIVHSGTGVSHTNGEVVKMIEEITGRSANITGVKELRSYDITDWKNEELNAASPEYMQLREGLEKYYAWYKEQL